MLVNSADRGSSAWYIGDPGTHGPTMDAPCEAPAACRDSRLDNAHVVPTLHRIYLHVHETWKGRFARARARTAVAWFETKFRIKFRIIFQNICITFPLCSREHASSILESIAASPVCVGTRTVNPKTSEFSSVGTCKKYRRTICSGTASRRKIMKNMTYRVLDPGFTMHA